MMPDLRPPGLTSPWKHGHLCTHVSLRLRPDALPPLPHHPRTTSIDRILGGSSHAVLDSLRAPAAGRRLGPASIPPGTGTAPPSRPPPSKACPKHGALAVGSNGTWHPRATRNNLPLRQHYPARASCSPPLGTTALVHAFPLCACPMLRRSPRCGGLPVDSVTHQ